MTGRYIEYGGIVTDAERDIRTGDRLTREVLSDEFKLVHWKSVNNAEDAEARSARRFSFCFSLRPQRLCVLCALVEDSIPG